MNDCFTGKLQHNVDRQHWALWGGGGGGANEIPMSAGGDMRRPGHSALLGVCNHEIMGEAIKGKHRSVATEPSLQEGASGASRELALLPFRVRCPICLQSESLGSAHRHACDKIPVFLLDHGYISCLDTGSTWFNIA